MARRSGSSGIRTMEAITRAGLDLLYLHGYEGMSLRRLAAAVGLQQGSLYNHFPSKQALLVHLYDSHMERLLAALDAALAGLADPAARLDAFVAFHVGYHVDRKREVFVVNSELRSLEPAARDRAIADRKRYERRLIAILEDGARSGAFDVPDVPVTAYAVLSMLSGICVWYDAAGRLDRDRLSALFRTLVMRSVRAAAPPGGP